MNKAGGVLVVDDDPGLTELLESLLVMAGFAVAVAPDGESALARVRSDVPEVIVLDVNLPGVSGYEVCRAIREDAGLRVPILFLSGERTEAYDRVAGLTLGADDYLVKPFAPDELLARVRGLLRRASNGRTRRLTRREREVLALLADGEGQNEIAERLVISPKTVATHIERILGKLGVHSRAEAVSVAFREQLLAPKR